MNLNGSPKVSWVKIGAKTPAGSNSITLAAPVDWEVGDEVVITSNRPNPREAEVKTITGINGNTITLNSPLQYPRMGAVQTYSNGSRSWTMDTRVEVGLLSRNITIQGGNDTTDANRYGAHVMIMNGSTGNADNVAFYRMGQGGTLGRYPWHWHLLGTGGEGQYITNCSIRKSYNRAITVHGTWGTLVDRNVAYDHLGHGIFLEDGSEINNVFSNNLVALSKRPAAVDAILDSDFEFNSLQNASPSSFWITNPGNTFINNIVAGTEGVAYWFAFPDRPTGLSGNLPSLSNLKPRETDFKGFSGNVAHSCKSGFDINDALRGDHSLRSNVGFNTTEKVVFKDFTSFSNELNVYAGIGGGQGAQGFRDNIIFDNLMSSDAKLHMMMATRVTFVNSLFVADSDNDIYNVNSQKSAVFLYDGAQRVFDCHFVNFNRKGTSLFENSGASDKLIDYLFKGVTYNHDGLPRVFINEPGEPVANRKTNVCAQRWSNVIRDVDGSLTRSGVPSSLVTDTDYQVFDQAYQPANWEGLHVLPDTKFVYLKMSNGVQSIITRKTVGCETSKFLETGKCNGGDRGVHFHVPVDSDAQQYEQSIYFSSLSGNTMKISVNCELETGQDVTVRYKGMGRLNNVRIDGITAKNSISAVRNSNTTAYYAESNGDLYVKFVTTSSFFGREYTVRWNGGNFSQLNVYNEEPNLMNAYITTSGQSGCTANATFHVENNPTKTQVQVSLDGGETYTETVNDNAGNKSFSNVPVGTVIYARWAGDSCGIPIGFVKNNDENTSCNDTSIPNIAPTVRIADPIDGATFEVGEDIVITANGSDPDGEVVRYSFFYDGTNLIESLTDGSSSITTSFSEAGTYRLNVRAADDDGAVTISPPIIITISNTTLSIVDTNSRDMLRLYPNPILNTLYVSGNRSSQLVKVYDLTGAVKLSTVINSNDNKLDFSNLANGLYMVRFIDLESLSSKHHRTFKIVKAN